MTGNFIELLSMKTIHSGMIEMSKQTGVLCKATSNTSRSSSQRLCKASQIYSNGSVDMTH